MKNDTDSVNRFSVFPCRIILSNRHFSPSVNTSGLLARFAKFMGVTGGTATLHTPG